MSGVFLGLIAETSIHVGIGSTDGVSVIDLPIAREKTTHYPFAPGSGVKGAFRSDAEQKGMSGCNIVFGSSDADVGAGQLMIGDLRLLLLPVRSSASAYKWLTCPHIIERFSRDRQRVTGQPREDFDFSKLEGGGDLPTVLTGENDKIYLEERLFQGSGELPHELVNDLKNAIPDEVARERLEGQLAVVSDADFAWFAQYAVPFYARNVLRDEKAIRKAEEAGEELPAPTKTSSNLWYEETLPPDTVMTLTLQDRGNENCADKVAEQYKKDNNPYLQVGGNETTGQGWFRLGQIEPNGGDNNG